MPADHSPHILADVVDIQKEHFFAAYTIVEQNTQVITFNIV